jgi:hypothetical protein
MGILSPGADHRVLSGIPDKRLSLRPVLVGYFSKTMPLGEVIGIFAGGAYMIVVFAALMLPETKGKTLVAFG